MGLYKIFKDAFYDVMTRNGFIHQGNVFLRVNGGCILQAVTVKPITGYEVVAAIFPLFDASSHNTYFQSNLDEPLGSKPYWAEDITLHFRAGDGFPYATKYTATPIDGEREFAQYAPFFNKEPYRSMAIANLQRAAEVMEEEYIPQFNAIYDLDSYLSWLTMSEINLDISRGRRTWVSARLLGCKSYYDGDFTYALHYTDAYLKAEIERAEKEVQRSIETDRDEKLRQAIYEASGERTPYLDYDTELRKKLAGARSGYNYIYGPLFEWIKNNDVSWVPAYMENETAHAKKLLKDRYSKLVL